MLKEQQPDARRVQCLIEIEDHGLLASHIWGSKQKTTFHFAQKDSQMDFVPTGAAQAKAVARPRIRTCTSQLQPGVRESSTL